MLAYEKYIYILKLLFRDRTHPVCLMHVQTAFDGAVALENLRRESFTGITASRTS